MKDMFKRFKPALLIALMAVAVVFCSAVVVHAASYYGADIAADAAGVDKIKSIPVLIGNILGTVLSFVAILFFVLMIAGGITWMTAHGNSSQTQKALDMIVAACIGMVIVMGSYALTQFVFDAIDGGGGGAGVGAAAVGGDFGGPADDFGGDFGEGVDGGDGPRNCIAIDNLEECTLAQPECGWSNIINACQDWFQVTGCDELLENRSRCVEHPSCTWSPDWGETCVSSNEFERCEREYDSCTNGCDGLFGLRGFESELANCMEECGDDAEVCVVDAAEAV